MARRIAIGILLGLVLLSAAWMIAALDAPIPGGGNSGTTPSDRSGSATSSTENPPSEPRPREPPREPTPSNPGSGGGQGGGSGGGTGQGPDPDRDVQPPTLDPKLLMILLGAIVGLLAILLIARVIRQRSRAGAIEESTQAARDPEDAATLPPTPLKTNAPLGTSQAVIAAYLRAVAKLSKMGITRARSETAGELASRAPLPARVPMRDLTARYEAIHHGDHVPTPQEAHQANALAEEVLQSTHEPTARKPRAPHG